MGYALMMPGGLAGKKASVQAEDLVAFGRGLKKHGEKPREVPLAEWRKHLRPDDVPILSGGAKPGHPAGEARAAVIDRGTRYIVVDSGYLGDRRIYRSASWDGLKGRGNHCSDDAPKDRLKRLGVRIRPWRDAALPGYALICYQLPRDAAVRGFDVVTWVRDAVTVARGYGFDVVVRPHPKAKPGENPPVPGADHSDRSLEEDLDSAAVCVTLNSNTAVTAVLDGVPSIAVDRGSMAWGVAGRSLSDLRNPPRPDGRSQWAAELAYSQWTHDEMAEGLTWERLKECASG